MGSPSKGPANKPSVLSIIPSVLTHKPHICPNQSFLCTNIATVLADPSHISPNQSGQARMGLTRIGPTEAMTMIFFWAEIILKCFVPESHC